MRIVWVAYTFAEYSLRHVNELARSHDVLLIMPQGEFQESQVSVADSVEVYAFDAPRLRQPWKQCLSIRSLHCRIRQFDPDVMHVQHGHLWFNLGLPWLRDLPIVITIHDPRHHAGDAISRKTPQWIMDYGFRHANQVIVHGESLVQSVVDDIGIAREKIHVIPHIAIGDVAQVGPPALAAAEEADTILFFGRIWAYKGLEYLIQAQPRISARFPRVKIVIAGSGEDLDRYRAMMHDPSRFVVINEWIHDAQRAALFQRAAVVVLPYTEATQSGVIPVAYQFAKPVIATRVGALAEAVEDGVTGRLVPARDVPALAEAIMELLGSPELRSAMGQAGKTKLEAENSPQVVVEKTLQAYRAASLQHPRTVRPAKTPIPVKTPENSQPCEANARVK